MSFLSNLFSSKTPAPVPRLDLTLGYPPAKHAVSFARKGDWRSLRELIAKESDITSRAFVLAACSTDATSSGWLDVWTASDPGNADAWLLTAKKWLAKGSEIRGAGRAEDVPEEAWDPFHECVDKMEQAAVKAADLRPDDPLPWQYRMTAAMVFGDPVESRMALFNEGKKRAPGYGGIYSTAVYAMTEKWGGSHSMMMHVAKEALASAPPSGTTIGNAVALAHVERWLYYGAFEKNAAAAAGHFKDAAVQREIRAAHAKSTGLTEPGATITANMFAFCFWKMGDKKATKAELMKAKGVFDDGFPWCYGGRESYAKAVQFAWS
jgi:hypothetical protein